MAQVISAPLNKTQLELLQLFNTELTDEEWVEVKRMFVRFLAEKVKRLADEEWDEKGWTAEDMKRLSQEHMRTPYKLRIVLDTNILLVAISPKSPYYPIFESFLNEEYTLCMTTEIFLEYEEILKRHRRIEVATGVLDIIENAPNTLLITRYFEWELIKIDPDDNKFVDCAIASNAKLIVTENHLLRKLWGKRLFWRNSVQL